MSTDLAPELGEAQVAGSGWPSSPRRNWLTGAPVEQQLVDLAAVLVRVNRARDAPDAGEACGLLVGAGRALFATHRGKTVDPRLRRVLDTFRPPESAAGARVVVAELARAMEVALGADQRLAVYGTLAPGRENHHVIEPMGGTWRAVELEGTLRAWGPYPVFEWARPGEAIAAFLLESESLPSFWWRLDAFETDRYARHLVPFTHGGGVGVTNCYVDGRDRR